MKRSRAIAYSAAVAVAVFVALAMPTLRTIFGPEAILAVYVGVAVVAGAVTYTTLPRVAGWLRRDVADAAEGGPTDGGQRADAADDTEDDPDVEGELTDAAVEQEIEQLREEG